MGDDGCVRPLPDPLAARLRTARAAWLRARTAWLGAWRRIGAARDAHGAAETGMHRMLELHAASCAGDALVAIGLAGTIFFDVPVGEARIRVALYLIATMAPFALLAPLVGPVLDRFRHGRRYALATTLLARGFLAYVIASRMDSWVLYPAAFAILVLSRAYGVARSAAIPRVLPAGMTLVRANARGSLFGTVTAAVVVPIGLLLAQIGPQWALGAALVPFVAGMVVALRLPAAVDSGIPETVPRLFGFGGTRRLFDGPVWAAVLASGTLRALYGFLALFFAFRTREDHLTLPPAAALGVIGAALAAGSFASTLAGARIGLRHPRIVQSLALATAAVACLGAAIGYSLWAAAALAFVTAVGSGLAKLSVDAVIQERLPDESRASAFAHSETLLQVAWVAGGALGLIPVSGRWGLLAAGILVAAAAGRSVTLAWSLRVKQPDPRPVA
jgi:MFS family permease